MKSNTNFFAKSYIITQSLFITMIPSTIMAIIHGTQYGEWITRPLVIATMIVEPILFILLAVYRFHKKHDEKLAIKWRKAREERQKYQKLKLKSKVGNLQQSDYYAIKTIGHESNKVCVFKITFFNPISKRAMPVITINDILLPIEMVNEHQVLCYAQKAVDTSMKTFVIKSGSASKVLNNPYYIPSDIPQKGILWQCEGHADKRNIYLNESLFPNKVLDTYYSFHFFAGGKSLGEFSGSYNPDEKAVVVNIGGINKHQCEDKKCLIKSVLDSGRKIELPKPDVFYVDNKQVKEIFSN